MSETKEALVEFFQKFPEIGVEIPNFESMINCVAAVALFQYFHGDEINIAAVSAAADKNDWYNLLKEIRLVTNQLEQLLKKSPYADKKIDSLGIARRGDLNILEELLIHIAFYSFISPKKKEAVEATKQLSKNSQNIIKKIIKPDPSPSTNSTSTPVKQEQAASTPNQTPTTPTSNSSLEDLSELKSKIETLTASNNKLKSENEALRNEINALKESSNSKQEENQNNNDPQLIMQKIAGIKAQIYVLQTKKKQKLSRKQALLDIQSRIPTLQENIEKIKKEADELQSKIDQNENKRPDYSILCDRLQELRADPKTKEVSDLFDEIKQLKKKLKDINKKKDLLQAKLDGQQGIAVLEDRKRFLQQLELTNQQRKQRAQLYLVQSQRKMRSEAFLQEMRSFL